MKKILFLIITLICTITVAKAESVCEIISGNGYGIGDEIACGSEHFYILENDGENIKALAKYNLYVGINIYEDRTEDIVTDKVLQNELAIGAHGGELGEPDPTQIAVTRFYVLNQNLENFSTPYGMGRFMDGELNRDVEDGAKAISYLNSYEQSLQEIGLTIKDKNLITISEINNLTKKITGNELPFAEWSNNFNQGGTNIGGDSYIFVIGSLKEILPSEYSWLWSTTYWTRTATETETHESSRYIFFIDTLGDVCEAYECTTLVGAGIRPVITFSSNGLEYIIETKTDGNGTLKAEKVKAHGGEVIKFTVTPNEGYVLSEVKVTDANGNVITFKEYTFTMPNANVLIEATFAKANPETNDINLIISSILVIISFTVILFYYQKLQKN